MTLMKKLIRSLKLSNNIRNDAKRASFIFIKYKNYFAFLLFIVIFFCLFLLFRDFLLFTPDYGLSDAYHQHLGFKFELFKHLQSNKVPFWSNQLAGGFPLFDEAQTGALFLPNLFFLKLFSFTDGYVLLFIFSLFLISFSMYCLFIKLKTPWDLSVLLAINFTFCAPILLRLVHLNIIQTISLTPLLFYLGYIVLKTHSRLYGLFFALILSQAIFAGYPQVVFIFLVGFYSYFVVSSWLKKDLKERFRVSFLLISMYTIAGVLIASPQIFSSLQLGQLSSRALSLDYQTSTLFSLPIESIVSFFNPLYKGTVRNGTYPHFNSNWGIYWESTAYVGEIFILTTIVLSFYFFLKRKSNKNSAVALGYLLVFIFLVVLSFGKYSPLYFLYNFAPFNLFRTPAKFLLGACFFLFLYAREIIVFFYVQQKKLYRIVICLLLLLNAVSLAKFGQSYHVFKKHTQILERPELAKTIDEDDVVLSMYFNDRWNEVFFKKGWAQKEQIDSYLFFRNNLNPNANLLFNISSADVYTGGLKLKRYDYVLSLLQESIKKSEDTVRFTDKTKNLLSMLGITHITTPYKLDDRDAILVDFVTHESESIYLYKIAGEIQENYYLPKKVIFTSYLSDFSKSASDTSHNLISQAVVEDNKLEISQENKAKITKFVQINNKLHFYSTSKTSSFIVLRVNHYPGWNVFVDGKQAPIFKTNLIHMGVKVPAGRHEIIASYTNNAFKKGLVVAILTLGGLMYIVFQEKISKSLSRK